jgi:hypothetical protein
VWPCTKMVIEWHSCPMRYIVPPITFPQSPRVLLSNIYNIKLINITNYTWIFLLFYCLYKPLFCLLFFKFQVTEMFCSFRKGQSKIKLFLWTRLWAWQHLPSACGCRWTIDSQHTRHSVMPQQLVIMNLLF